MIEDFAEAVSELHPDTAELVVRFATAMAKKFRASEIKYGWSNNWSRPDWEQECREHFHTHVTKGDPRDVGAYAAFMWHHGWSTASQTVTAL